MVFGGSSVKCIYDLLTMGLSGCNVLINWGVSINLVYLSTPEVGTIIILRTSEVAEAQKMPLTEAHSMDGRC